MAATQSPQSPVPVRVLDLLHSVIRSAMEHTGAVAGAVCLADIDAGDLEYVAAAGLQPTTALPFGTKLPLRETLIGRCALAAQPVIIHDYANLRSYETPFRPIMPHVRAVLWVPLIAGEHVIGVLGLGHDTPGYFRDQRMDVLASLTTQAALAIENARLFEQAQSQLARLSSMYRVAQALSASIDLQPVIETVIRIATEQSTFPIASLALLRPGTHIFDMVASVNMPEEFRLRLQGVEASSPLLRRGALERAMLSQSPAVVQDVRELIDAEAVRDTMVQAGLLSYICVPLVAKGRFEGALYVYDTRPRPDAAEELPLLAALGDHAAIAIANAQLYESMEESLRQTRALQRVTSAVATSLDLEEILQHALTAAMQLFTADRAAIYMNETPEGPGLCVASHGLSRAYLDAVEERYPLAAGGVAEKVDHLYIADAATDPRMAALHLEAQREGFRSMMFVSLRYRGERTGMFVLYHDTVRAYAETEIGLARTFAEQAAIAIEHARLFNETRRLAVVDERNRLARELHDSVNQSLFSISLIAQALPELLDKQPARALERIDRLADLARGALAEMRALLFELRPAALEQEGLVAAIAKYAAAFESREGVKVELRVEGERRLPLDHEEALFRVAQEALNNVAKHARAGRVEIALDFTAETTCLAIGDDGVGFEPAAGPTSNGFGMTSMRERTALVAGTLAVESRPGIGTTVRAHVPCVGQTGG